MLETSLPRLVRLPGSLGLGQLPMMTIKWFLEGILQLLGTCSCPVALWLEWAIFTRPPRMHVAPYGVQVESFIA